MIMKNERQNNFRQNSFKQWRVGMYLRLSREDEVSDVGRGRSDRASVSIDNQRAIILNFLEEDPLQFVLAETYVDDGISGTTAEHRPAFMRLIEDIKSGLIDCAITNDTSRFARNVSDAEYYVNTVFPTYGARFISLGSPRIDSYEDPESVESMQFHFDGYFNEYYVKTISGKTRAVLSMKAKQGDFIGSFAPYGYAKDPANKNKLIVDEEAAEIVRKMFDMFVYDKLSLRALALKLNDMGILPPREYKLSKGIKPGSHTPRIPSWHCNTVKLILSDEKYCGHMVQGKVKNISYKVKKVKHQAPEDWIIVRNTHEPIISEDLYQKAQTLLIRPSRTTKSGEKSLYSGFVYCSNCGHALNRGRSASNGKHHYRCGFHKATRKCRPLHISEEQLSEQLLLAVKSQIVLVAEMDVVKQSILSSNSFVDDSKLLKSNLTRLEKERDKLEARSHKLYDDYSDGIIDKELYISRSSLLKQELETAKDRIAKIKIEIRQFKQIQSTTDDYAERFKKYETVSEITRELLVDLVDRILIDKTDSPCGNHKKQRKHIKVAFKFADQHKALVSFISENEREYRGLELVAL